MGVPLSFLLGTDGVGWGCDACDSNDPVLSTAPADNATRTYMCLTCNGYPPGHPECENVAWGQTFPDVPT